MGKTTKVCRNRLAQFNRKNIIFLRFWISTPSFFFRSARKQMENDNNFCTYLERVEFESLEIASENCSCTLDVQQWKRLLKKTFSQREKNILWNNFRLGCAHVNAHSAHKSRRKTFMFRLLLLGKLFMSELLFYRSNVFFARQKRRRKVHRGGWRADKQHTAVFVGCVTAWKNGVQNDKNYVTKRKGKKCERIRHLKDAECTCSSAEA